MFSTQQQESELW